jgi:hypothetical protein
MVELRGNRVFSVCSITPQDFNLCLSITPPTQGQVTINVTRL